MEIFLKIPVTVDEQGLAALVYVGQIVRSRLVALSCSPVKPGKVAGRKLIRRQKGEGKLSIKLSSDMGPDSFGDYRTLYNCE